MQKLRRLFALLFILSLFVGVVHELSHSHHNGEPCEVCVLSHAPALLEDAVTVTSPDHDYEKFTFNNVSYPVSLSIQTRNRSPPLA